MLSKLNSNFHFAVKGVPFLTYKFCHLFECRVLQKVVAKQLLIFSRNTLKMSAVIPQRSPCIFCNIVNKFENTEILFEDEDVCVFRDIKPASRFHVLTIPKRHIEDARSLTSADKEIVAKMLAVAKDVLSKNNLSVTDARFGYHWPPFRSVKHLHLHAIAPESEMGFISKMIFKKDLLVCFA